MTYKLKRIILYILLTILLLAAFYIFIYYLMAGEVEELRNLPPTFLISVVIYIVAQLIKRFFEEKIKWYNWLYYIGLIAIVIPLPLFKVTEDWIFTATRLGTLFLFIPPIIDLIQLSKSKPNSLKENSDNHGDKF